MKNVEGKPAWMKYSVLNDGTRFNVTFHAFPQDVQRVSPHVEKQCERLDIVI
ncbi:MAG: hypothetical protein FGF53_02015 [Candidatus Brockarchaeota archaeon]|nr:hypothetical protein [Candidatus Brockarchaeota archaeon]MBO3809544.1 hypothetical protein [Candidatus Brockarchaeota archaeon]